MIAAVMTLALMATPAVAGGDSLFDRTELRCVLNLGGQWNFSRSPPRLEDDGPWRIVIDQINYETGTARTGKSTIGANKTSRSVEFINEAKGGETIVMSVSALPNLKGWPAAIQAHLLQQAGHCN